jgi:SpoVK/Ycf46/Vps4 family AAA+-type ATPase
MNGLYNSNNAIIKAGFGKTEEATKHNADLLQIFDEGNSIQPKRLYVAYFHAIPNAIKIDRINVRKAQEWFSEHYKADIRDTYFSEIQWGKGARAVTGCFYYIMYEDMMVHLDLHENDVRLMFRVTDIAKVRDIAEELKRFRQRRSVRKPSISLIISGHNGLSERAMQITRPKLSIQENYNDDFIAVNETILKRLRKDRDKGLVLLHGKPGTGKTSYIRWLITNVRKDVIFLPPNMAGSITDPSLMNVLIDNPNSIFVIEDAENIIIDRNRTGGSSSVSALLNLADGLLSDCLNIQIICSFNTDISRVDNALLRKGRLIAKYEFGELEATKAQALSNKLGFNSLIDNPMTLADIYNQNDADYSACKKRPSVGFRLAG